MLKAHYEWRLVALSVAIAIAASYTALDLAGRIAAARGRTRMAWLIGGATSMGLGIWAMHYIGMLAYQLPLEVFYSLPEVGISLLAAIAASAVALYVVSSKELTPAHLVTGSLTMGGGIAAMHYVGMRAMRVSAHRSYSLWIVALSILVAVAVSGVALFLAFRLREEDEDTVWSRPLSAAVMGFAVAGMHYLGMAAVCFHDAAPMSEQGLTNVSSLGVFSIATVTFTVLALSLVGSMAKSRFLRQERELALEQEHRRKMEEEIAARKEAETKVLEAYEWMGELVAERTAELQESQAKWKGLVAALPQLIWTANSDGQITFVSEECTRYTASAREDLLGRAFMTYVHPDDRDHVTATTMAGHATQSAYEHELRLRSKDGVYRWFLSRAQPLFEVEGDPPTQWLGCTTDIDDQKRSKEVLEEAVAQRTVALEEAVARAECAVQAKEEEIAARCAAETQVRMAYERMEALVTERTAKLQASQAKWKGLIAALPQLIWTTDPNGQITFVSDACMRYSGTTEKDLLGAAFADYIHPDDLDRVLSTMAEAHAAWIPYTLELRLLSRDGEYRWFQNRGQPVYEVEGEPPTQWLGSSTDIDDQKCSRELLEAAVAHRTEALEEALEQAECATRAKSDFLAVMSHEIRTPMNGVIGMAHLMLDTPLTETQRGYLDAIRSSGQALLTIINDILDFSKIEAGKLEIYEEEFDLRTVAGECMDLVGPGASQKQLALTLKWDDAIPPLVLGDSGRLRQILLNLLSNAVKFTPVGAVSLRVSREPGAGAAEMLRFAVRDSGIGLSPEQIGTLFQAFAQADISTTRRFGGTGLGLSIARRLVELMGGRIGVESRVGEGSTFWFELPLKAGRAVAAESAGKRETPRASMKDLFADSGLRVLIADDVVTNQMVARGLLGELGLRADAVSNGAEAIAVLETIHYDLVLMDVHMPEMDGLEATRRIRERVWDVARRERRLPIIALTASAMPGDRQKFLEAGMDDFISKPIMPAALVAILRKWLPEARTVEMPETAPVESVRAVSVFDKAGLLSRVMGDAQLAQAVMEGFVYDMPRHVEELLRLVREGGLEEIADLAHRVRGASATVGGEAVKAITEEMETAARAGDRERVAARGEGLEAEFGRLLEALAAERVGLLAA